MLTAPFVLILALFAVPFFSNSGERHISRRPIAALLLVFIFFALFQTYQMFMLQHQRKVVNMNDKGFQSECYDKNKLLNTRRHSILTTTISLLGN